MKKSPKYLLESLQGEDFFKVHSKISNTLFQIIKSEDLSKGSFTLGLLGSWGSGKSKVVSLLKQELKNEKDIFFIEFDVWKYVDSSLYRSILFDLEKELIHKAEKEIISSEFKEGYKNSNGEKLYDILYSDTELIIPQEPIDNFISKWIKACEKKIWGNILSKLILRPVNLFIKVFSYLFKRIEIIVVIAIFIAVLISGYVYRESIYTLMPFTKTETFKFLFKLFFAGVVGIGALEFLKEFFKDFFKELLPKEIKNIIITSPPTFAQDQFEYIFKDIIRQLHKDGSNKIVLVFDNIDRCETDITLKVLTGLKTFLDEPNCFYLIPCDDIRIKQHFHDSAKGDDDYLDKIFQAYLRIPLLTENNKIEFIENCIKESEFELDQSDKVKISQILTLAYKGNTPRQIKRFFNDFISYYKLAENIDPNHSFLLKEIGHFTFMITIKQKWLSVEDILIKNPTAFKIYVNGQTEIKYPTDFLIFFEQCHSWIDLDCNPANFIYLVDAKQSGSNVQKIILENYDDFVLNNALVNELSHLFDAFALNKKYLFLETGIERLKVITEKYLKEDDKFLGVELFKIYLKNILLYDSLTFDNKKQSFVLTHAAFIAEFAEYIALFNRNTVNEVEVHLLSKIKETGSNGETISLFKSFVKHFKNYNVSNIFQNVADTDIEKLSPFVLTLDVETGVSIFSKDFLNKIGNAITLKKEENNLIKIFKHLDSRTEINDAKKIISQKITLEITALKSATTRQATEKFILEALTILKYEDWEAKDKINFDKQLLTRITILFNNGDIATAISYSINACLLRIKNLATLFNADGSTNLYLLENFEKLLTAMTDSQLQFILQDNDSRNVLIKTCSAHNKFNLLFKKLPTIYLKENLEMLYQENINCIISILEIVGERKEDSEDLRKALEKNIYDLCYEKNKTPLLDSFNSIFPKMTFGENKFSYAVVTVNHLSQDINRGIAGIINILNNINFENASELYDKIYTDNKISFLKIDNSNLFNKIISNVSATNQSDYMERLLSNMLPNLKGGSGASNILKSFKDKLPTNLFNENGDLFDNIILELLELSRNEEDNVIGIQLLNEIHGNDDKTKGKFLKKIEAIRNHAEKSVSIKELIQTHFPHKETSNSENETEKK